MTTRIDDVFSFLRGAIRGAYGAEDFRAHKFLLVGMQTEGQALLSRLCLDETNIRFEDSSLENLGKSFSVCGGIDVYGGEAVDIIVDFNSGFIVVKDKAFPISKIEEDPYTQGIHAFYLD